MHSKANDRFWSIMMLPAERRRRILEEVERRGAVRTSELSELFSISPITIRHDLRELARKGLLVRTHGGAVSRGQSSLEFSHDEKALRNIEEKKRIAEKAAAMIADGSTVFLGPGSTTLQMIPHLYDKKDLTVITNSLNIAMELARIPTLEVEVVGGVLRRVSFALVGPLAERCFEDFFVDQLFFGVHAVSLEHGLTEPDIGEAKLYKLMLRCAHRRIVLADHSKFRKFAHAKIADLADINTIITDNLVDEGYIEAIRDLGVEVVVV